MKLLASDVDNTLLFEGKIIKDKDIRAVKKFREAGHIFGVCTGRSLNGVLTPSQSYDIDYDFFIMLSGAVIYNKSKEIIFEKRIPMELIKRVYQSLNPSDMTVIVHEKVYRICKENKNEFFSKKIKSLTEIPYVYAHSFSFHFPKDKVEQATKAVEFLKERFNDQIGIFQNNEHIDMAMKGCSKGEGLKFIQDYFNVNSEDLYCIGDSWNDLPMFEETTHPYTFTYAPLSVQEKAEVIVESLAMCIEDIMY